MGESGTQNSASSAVELAPLAPDGSSRLQDRLDLADGVLDYINLTEHWATVAEQNENYLRKTGKGAAHASRAEAQRTAAAAAARAAAAAAGKDAGEQERAAAAAVAAMPHPLVPGQCSAAALADAHRVGQLILAVGFEAGMWDLPSVLDIARQAADAIGNLVEEHGTPPPAAAAAAVVAPGAGGPAAGNGSTATSAPAVRAAA